MNVRNQGRYFQTKTNTIFVTDGMLLWEKETTWQPVNSSKNGTLPPPFIVSFDRSLRILSFINASKQQWLEYEVLSAFLCNSQIAFKIIKRPLVSNRPDVQCRRDFVIQFGSLAEGGLEVRWFVSSHRWAGGKKSSHVGYRIQLGG